MTEPAHLSLSPGTRKHLGIALMIGLVLVAALVVFHTMNPEQMEKTLREANPWWLVAAVGAGAVTWVGAALPVVAFAPVPTPFRDSLLVQMASSFAGVVAPSGLGGFAVTVRYFVKRGVQTTAAVGTLSLIEIAVFLTTLPLVLVAVLFAGLSPDLHLNLKLFLWIGLGLAVVLGGALALPQLRRWSGSQLRELWAKTKPQLIWVSHHPKRLAVAGTGALIQTLGFIGAAGACLAAFGHDLSLWAVGAAYLVANTLGSMIPVPGGVGSIEASLAAALHLAGAPVATAISAAVAFRLVTFYFQIPVGYVALRVLRHRQLV